jgi:prepilin-type N-terminal cleavage/methylation domain-containing protein
MASVKMLQLCSGSLSGRSAIDWPSTTWEKMIRTSSFLSPDYFCHHACREGAFERPWEGHFKGSSLLSPRFTGLSEKLTFWHTGCLYSSQIVRSIQMPVRAPVLNERRMTMLKKFRKSEKGFTLIELLIVVAIIGILAAIAIPQFSAYRQKAYNSAAQSDLKNLKTGFEAYMADNQKYPEGLDIR